MKYLFLAISSFLAIVAQTIAGSNFFLFNFLDLSLILIAYWAIYRSRTQALFVGCITGIMLDAVLGWPLGYNGFGKTIAAFVIGQTSRRVNVGETWICFVLMASASCLNSLSVSLLFWLMQRRTSGIFLGASVVQALITAGVGVVLFAIVETYTQAQARKTS